MAEPIGVYNPEGTIQDRRMLKLEELTSVEGARRDPPSDPPDVLVAQYRRLLELIVPKFMRPILFSPSHVAVRANIPQPADSAPHSPGFAVPLRY